MIDRRALIRNVALLAAANSVWGCVKSGMVGALTLGQLKILTAASGIVIPKTETAGAIEAGVPAFVTLALAHGLDSTADSKTPGAPPANDYGAWLEQSLGRDFATLPTPVQSEKLTAIDAVAFKPGMPTPWTILKGLILTGYYTSEAGASQELRYELVPGRWDPDIPAKPGDRAWSSDWTAVEFG
jgi:Gluconate 2-dehydrogenase subunit 3